MAKWASPVDWSGIDLTGHCRIWKQDQDGTQRRMTNRAKVWTIAAAALNHLEGRTPRMLFCQALDAVSVEACNSNPTYSVKWIDNKINARERTVRVLALPRDSDVYNSNSLAEVYTNAAGSTNAAYPESCATPTFPVDLTYRTFHTSRGASTNAVYCQSIATSNGVNLMDVCCQEDYVNTLDSGLGHDFVFSYSATPGAPIVTGVLEDLRAKFHRLRMGQNRLAFCFLGAAASNVHSCTSTGIRGFKTSSETYVNILDQTITARTATSPGVMAPGYKAGVGQSNACGVQIYILAKKYVGDGYFKVIGPDHVADNNVEIAVTYDTVEWYTSGPVYLNTESAEATDTTTARNKFDFHFLATPGAPEQPTSEFEVYTILGFTLQT